MSAHAAIQRKTMPGRNGGTLGRFAPGVSGNPLGRPSAGMSIREWINGMANFTEGQLRHIARMKSAPISRRIAAIQLLEAGVPGGDLSEFEGFLNGSKTLAELKKAGADTRVLKKATVRRDSEGGESRSIELRSGGGEYVDRVFDRTEGKPTQRVEVVKPIRDPVQILNDLKALMQASPEMAARISAMIPVDGVAVPLPASPDADAHTCASGPV